MKKYETLKEVVDAKVNGELHKDHILSTDNDYMSLIIPNPKDPEDYITLFEGETPAWELDNLLKAFGINVQGV